MFRARSARVALPALAALAALGTPPAAAAVTPVGAVRWELVMDRSLPQRLSDGCLLIGGADWHPSGQTKAREPIYGTGVGAELATGGWAPAAASGSVTAKGDALRFDAIPSGKATGKPFKLSRVGLELAGGRVYLTGEIRRIKPLAAAAPVRQRLAVIAHPKLLSGPFHNKGKPPIADSFIFAVQGRATLTTALAAALRRARCSTRLARAHRIRTGAALGLMTAQLLPTAATGLGGRVDVEGGLQLEAEDGTAVAVTPSGGPTAVTIDRSPSLRFPIAPPTAAPLSCKYGAECRPTRGAAIALAGQLVLSYAGRATVLSGLVATYAPYDDVPTVTGTLDGAPVTVYDPAADAPTPEDFLARVGAALGTTVIGELGHAQAHFTSTGPL